ncbi:MAG: hypothetical protein ABIA37_03395 [Candidatus Woesearchaeota archaeon]
MEELKLINKRIAEAEKRIKELVEDNSLKKLDDQEKYKISRFYENKSANRLQTAKLIFNNSTSQDYEDYSEVVSAAYYSMYYIVHAFLALKYKKKIKEEIRGIHAITHHLVLYYLVKTEKLAKHLYEEYINTLETTAKIQKFNPEDYQKKAYNFAKSYQEQKTRREVFTYYVSKNAERSQAEKSIKTAEEFIDTIKQVML